MTAPLFYVPASAAPAGPDALIQLSGAEGRHAVSVLRVVAGERIDISDGAGTMVHAVVEAITGRDSLVARVLSREVVAPSQPSLTVVQALPKSERAELAVATLTEVGVDVIVPWQAQRSVGRWAPEKQDRARAKWIAAARAAAKQSRRARLPEVPELAGLEDVATLIGAADAAVVLHEDADVPLAGRSWPATGRIVLVVGPEGGISPAELVRLSDAGADVVRLGPTVLRTSTAGTVAAAVVLAATPRWA